MPECVPWLVWCGNILIVSGIFYMGKQPRRGFVLALAGEIIYVVYSTANRLWGVLFLSAFIASLYLRNLRNTKHK